MQPSRSSVVGPGCCLTLIRPFPEGRHENGAPAWYTNATGPSDRLTRPIISFDTGDPGQEAKCRRK